MTTKNFFKITKWKFLIIVPLFLITAVFFLFNSPRRGDTIDNNGLRIFALPGVLIYNMNIPKETWPTIPEKGIDGGFGITITRGNWDPTPKWEYPISPRIATSFIIISTLIYWYLIACLVTTLVSEIKKKTTQSVHS